MGSREIKGRGRWKGDIQHILQHNCQYFPVFSSRNSPLAAIDSEGANKAEKIEIKVFAKGSFAKPLKGLF